MKTEFSIWACRDGVSKSEPKIVESRGLRYETNENGIFDLAVLRRSIQDGRDRGESRQGQEETAFLIRLCRDGVSGTKHVCREAKACRLEMVPL